MLQSEIPPSLQYYWPGQYHGFDREGRPVYVSRAGSIDMHGFMNIDGVTDVDRERFHIYNLQLGEYFMKEATKICSRTVDQIVVIYDLKDIPISQISPKFVVFLIKLIDLEQTYYPSRIHQVYFVNTPKKFNVWWTPIKSFLGEKILEHLIILGTNFREEVTWDITTSQLPEWLGGRCTQCPGGCVPAGGFIPTCVYDEKGTEDKKVIVTVDHRREYTCSVAITHENMAIQVIFRTQKLDIDFGVYLTRQEIDGLQEYEVLELERINSHTEDIKKRFVCRPGVYKFVWDNTYSLWSDKHLKYHISVRSLNKKE